jgi:hypothetical protein
MYLNISKGRVYFEDQYMSIDMTMMSFYFYFI